MNYFFHPGTLPAYFRKKPEKKTSDCPHDKFSAEKAKWRIVKRKYDRWIEKERQKKAGINVNKNVTPEDRKLAREARKGQRKHVKARKLRKRQRRHRIFRRILASKRAKTEVIAKGQMKPEDIRERLAYLKSLRVEHIYRYLQYRYTCSAPQRKAARHLRWDWTLARHRRKRYQKYRRWMAGRAKKMGLSVWRNCDMKQKPHSVPTKKVEWQAPGKTGWKRVTYENKFPVVQTLNSVEIESNFKHISKGTKFMLGNMPMTTKDDVIGNMGRVVCRYLALNQYHQTIYHFHFRAAINFDSAGSKEAQILSKLNMNRSHNAMRVMRYGQYLNLQYILTQELSSDLGFIVQNTTLDLFSSVHLIQQTFYCISDLHKIGYTHLDIRPSSFSLLRNNKAVVVLNSFFNSETRQNISRNIRTTKHNGLQPLYVQQARHARNKSEREPLPKNVINTYMSRRQHFRLARGPADDYESWFYICARFITLKTFEWHDEEDHIVAATMKYNYLATCTFPDPDTNERMAKILQYCLSATNTNANVVAFYLERVIQNWKENIPPKEFYSWQDTDSVNTKHEAWMERNKTWYAPRKPRCAEY
ncbi:Protein kinase domain-containing protein [Caenorhabditis elegans]|uniref:Protein kinase domain-containing protein n=1 Tax=Caenorhabditis elegans TaxID=6239 RepID=O16939_CAEEL|nr:Protein kinase domain-containing protein [Caenorhabditis elegans]NP_001255992.1 Protein kinase domain-containing protein [Caenorhabditis elegans]CCD71081.1 Protein kinase domain-containing protein [Caenorhabditis elegans]CCD71083.1 Protein kinase domain-containing protein [Caenorhabditis elegans]|eukprot:NP_001255991.1 Uncharacterized protein CELE_K09C6.7 [Caenorhabditis elegans]